MKYILLDNVQEDMVLAKCICDKNGTLLLLGNQKLTKSIINSLKNFKVPGVYIYSNMTDLLEQLLYKCTDLVNQLIKKDNTKLLSYFQKYHNETYQHSINVSILSLVIGVKMNLTSEELYNLALAALLHDIGKLKIPLKILNKAGKLTNNEYEEMKSHTILGYEMLKKYNLDDCILNAILQHHENEDGSGYPNHLKGNQISKLAKIIHLADVYDALTNKRCYKEKINESDVLEFIYANTNTSFDKNIVDAFRNSLFLYPIGSLVKLSNNNIATVIDYKVHIPTRPTVQVENGEIIDLNEKLNIVITKLIT